MGGPAPAGVQVVTRTHGSAFFINTESKSRTVKLAKPANDRISGEEQSDEARIRAGGIFWLE